MDFFFFISKCFFFLICLCFYGNHSKKTKFKILRSFIVNQLPGLSPFLKPGNIRYLFLSPNASSLIQPMGPSSYMIELAIRLLLFFKFEDDTFNFTRVLIDTISLKYRRVNFLLGYHCLKSIFFKICNQ